MRIVVLVAQTLRHPDLLASAVIAIAMALQITLYPDWNSPIRALFGFVMVLVVPGYVLHVLLFPRRGDTHGIERIAVTLGLSIVVIPLCGLFLHYTPWGIRPVPIAIALAVFVVATALLATLRLRRLPTAQRFALSPGRPGFGAAVALGGLVVAVVTGVVSLTLSLRPEHAFTEFYVLGPEGQMSDYPASVVPGASFDLTFGVGSREAEPSEYVLRFPFGDNPPEDVGELFPGSVWERTLTLRAPREPGCTKLSFELDKAGEESPYRQLHLFVPVQTADTSFRDRNFTCP